METPELISWLPLAIAFVGALGIFTTTTVLRKMGGLAMGTGLTVFCLAGLYAVLHGSMADNVLYPPLAAFAVLAAAVTAGWLTRLFYRDFDPNRVEDGYYADSE